MRLRRAPASPCRATRTKLSICGWSKPPAVATDDAKDLAHHEIPERSRVGKLPPTLGHAGQQGCAPRCRRTRGGRAHAPDKLLRLKCTASHVLARVGYWLRLLHGPFCPVARPTPQGADGPRGAGTPVQSLGWTPTIGGLCPRSLLGSGSGRLAKKRIPGRSLLPRDKQVFASNWPTALHRPPCIDCFARIRPTPSPRRHRRH